MLGRIAIALVFSMCALACGGVEPGVAADGGLNADSDSSLPGSMVLRCVMDADCSDAVFCNGTERCVTNNAAANTRGCVVGVAPCAGACDEIHDTCLEALACVAAPCSTDADCGQGGDACSATASCNAASAAADARGCVSTPAPTCTHGCDPVVGCLPASPTVTVCLVDLDCGGYCNGYVCEPGNANSAANGCRHLPFVPSAACAAMSMNSVCCEAVGAQARGCANPNLTTCVLPHIDRDADGHDSVVTGGDDCDDLDGQAFPGNVESCDALGRDEDCDPATVSNVPGQVDADGDGVPSSRCWNRGLASDAATAYTVHSSGVVRGADCDDADATASPFAPDFCNGRDDDCDGSVDEFVTIPMYIDRDGDGFGDATCTFSGCGTEAGFVRNAFDCADYNPALIPGAGACVGDTTLGICASGVVVPASCGFGQRCVTHVDGTGNCERDDH